MLGDGLMLVMLVLAASWAGEWLPRSVAHLVELGRARLPMAVGAALLTLMVTGAYRPTRHVERWSGVLLAGALVGVVPLLAWLPEEGGGASHLWFAMLAVVVTWGWLALGRMLSGAIADGIWPGSRGLATTIIVGTRSEFRKLISQLEDGRWREYRVVGRVSAGARGGAEALGGLPALPALLDEHQVDTVIVGPATREARIRSVWQVCREAGCELLYPAIGPSPGDGLPPRLVWRDDHPYFAVGTPVLQPGAMVVKRIVDLLAASVLLVLLSPLLLLLALLIRLDSPGPVLFVQHRAGFGGDRFRMLKFRTMKEGADEQRDAVAHLNQTGDPRLFKIPHDPRVTRTGHWLRLWSLDELPQLWNVIVGDMSLVGPRPFPERDLVGYEDRHFLRLGAKPGITGLWQVNGRSSIVDFEEVVRLDREYIERWSIWLDLRILWRTIPVVLGRTGAF